MHLNKFMCLFVIVGCIITISSCSNLDQRYPPKIPYDTSYIAPTNEQKLWALAVCAILTESNNERHDILGGAERTQDEIQGWKASLKEWWGVNNRADLLKTLKWIEEGGHRKQFDKFNRYLSIASPEDIAAVQNKWRNNPESLNKFEIALKYSNEFGEKSISAWDYSRYISLCGWGYIVGYLTEEEAWQKIMPAARVLQITFNSWEELGKNYVVGREFWSLKQTKQRGDLTSECYNKLLNDPESPWILIPWNLNLTKMK